MKRILVACALLMLCAGASMAQKGSAEPDYYPPSYTGDTWSGEVTAVNEETREFTLTYAKGDKTQTFVGTLPKGYAVKMKDGQDHEVQMAELMGLRIKVYYITKNKKDAQGVKVKTNEVFKIKPLPKDK
ncbi:MAG: hypothetical protein WCF57_09905 [Pyrinomonadaceae bacterium]